MTDTTANPLWSGLFGRHEGAETPFLHLPDGSSLSHADFIIQSARIANALTAMGLRPGDRVAAQIEKCPEALALYAACVRTGLVFLPLNTGYTADEISYFVTDSGAGLFVCDPARASEMRPIAKAARARLATLSARGGGTLPGDAATQSDQHQVVAREEGDLAAFLYTSGTTGRSKGAMLTQANLLSNARTLSALWQFTSEDVLLHALPIFHTHGLFVATNVALVSGCALVFMPKFDLDALIAAMPRATALMGVPTFYTRLLGDPRFTRDLTANMRLFVSGSAPLLADTHVQFEERTGHRILERYGMTETNMNTSNPYEGARKAGTVGLPLPGVEVRVADKKGKPVAQGEVGSVEVRGPNVFKGYWNMPDKTAAEFRADGFFITGDLGQIDEDGYLSIVGRDKDLIISGGYNIYPKEVETVLDAQPGVLESAVIGVPDSDFGEAVVGVLVPQPGATIDTEAVMDAVRQSLARFKHPKRLDIVAELPRNTMGKVQKNVLRATHAGAAG